MPVHSWMAGAWAAVICGWIAACGGDPTDPVETSPAVAGRMTEAESARISSAGPALLAVSMERETTTDVSDEVNALESRFLSSIEPAAGRELARALERAVARAGRKDREGAVQALGAARIALKVGTATPADLEALNRSLDAMLAAMEAPSQ